MPIAAARMGIRHNAVSAPAAPSAVLLDDFTRADSTSTFGPATDGGSYYTYGLGPGISSNRAYMYGNAQQSPITHIFGSQNVLAAMRDLYGSGDIDYSIDITRANVGGTADGASWLGFGMDAVARNGFVLAYDSSATMTLRSVLNNTPTDLATITATAWTGGTTTIRVTYVAATGVIKVYQNGTQIGTTTSTGNTGTHCGFGSTVATSSSGEYWDNFRGITGSALAVFFSDDFNRTDRDLTTDGYLVTSLVPGNNTGVSAAIVSNQAQVNGGLLPAAYKDMGQKEKLIIDVTYAGGTAPALAGRIVSGVDESIRWRLDNGSVNWRKVGGSGSTSVGSATPVVGDRYRWIIYQNGWMGFFRNEQYFYTFQLDPVTYPGSATATYWGIGVETGGPGSATLDNLVVRKMP